jgi:hypothetical protein
MTTVGAPSTAAPLAASGEAREVIEGHRSSSQTEHFLAEVAPTLVTAALHSVLPTGAGILRCTVTRSKLKPHRKLTAYVEVSGAGLDRRPVAATWTLPPSAPQAHLRPADPPVADALRGPFATLRVPADAAGMSILVSPLDPAFPQLAGLHDPARLGRLLTSAGLPADPDALTVTPLRYRPGQRHVLRIDLAGTQEAFYAKCYRDDTGARAVRRCGRIAAALRAWGGPADTVAALAYVESERLVLWHGSQGVPLSRIVTRAPALAGTAGAALRALHDDPVSEGASAGQSDPVAEAGATVRSCEHVVALAPEAAGGLLGLVAHTAERLGSVPPESGHRLHGDYKCDNMLVEGQRLRLLDFDRVTIGDPALDLGKLCADLRWWARVDGVDPEAVVSALLAGYGPCPATRLLRAGHYDVLFQLRAAGRRVQLHEPAWPERVEAALRCARQTSEALR